METGQIPAPPPRSARMARWAKHHWPTTIAGGCGLALLLWAVALVSTSRNIEWAIVRKYLFAGEILKGLAVTLELTIVAMLVGTLIAVVLAAMGQSTSIALRVISGLYIWFYRGTPLLVQLIFWYNIALFVPDLRLGSFEVQTNEVVTPLTAALLGLSLNVAAYMAEIIRGGILAIDRGQTEAALALGYTSRQALFRVVLPQTVRVIMPPSANLAIDLLKATAIVSVIGTGDLLTKAQSISAVNFRVIELLIVASSWYLIVVSVATILQNRLERSLGRSLGSAGGGRLRLLAGRKRGNVVTETPAQDLRHS